VHIKLDKNLIENIYELTESQTGIFYDCMKIQDTGMYVIQNMIEITGVIDKARFLQAIYSVISTHTILRSVLRWEGLSTPVCVVKRNAEPHVLWEQVNMQAPEKGKIQALADKMISEGIQLDNELIKFSMLQGELKSVFIVQFHHIILDGWSFSILIKELMNTYQNSKNSVQVDDYFTIYKQLPINDPQAIQFWNNIVKDVQETNLPIRLQRNSLAIERKKVVISLETDVDRCVKEFSTRMNVPLASVIYTVWSILLSKYTGQDKISFGVVMSGRNPAIPNILEAVGLFSNTVTWHMHITSASFVDAVTEAAELTYKMQNYQYTPLHIVNGLKKNKTSINSFETMVAIENYPIQHQFKDLMLQHIDTLENNSIPLSLSVLPAKEITFEFDYNKAIFKDDDINRLVGHFLCILVNAVTYPDKKLTLINMLNNEEKALISETFKPDLRRFPDKKTVIDLIKQIANDMPDEIALHDTGTDNEMTYVQMEAMATAIASKILMFGGKKGDIICLISSNRLEIVPSMLGIMKCGCAFLPIDNTYPPARIQSILNKAKPSIILTHQEFLETFDQKQYKIISIEDIDPVYTPINIPVTGEDTAYLIATSGTTGEPKCIEVSHLSFVDFVTWTCDEYKYKKKTRAMLSLSFAFDSALIQIFPSLICGGILYIIDTYKRSDPKYYLSKLKKHRIEVIDEIPTLLNLLFQEIEHERMYHGISILPDIKCISLGSEYVPAEVARKCRKYLSHDGMIVNSYGPAEATVVVTTYEFNGWDETEESLIGKPRGNSQILILDKYRQLCPVGVPGELYISGICLAKGYYNDPDETQLKFINNPFHHSENYNRLYATGDRGRWLQDGNIEFLGRIDNQIKFHGYRIEIEGLEAQLQNILGNKNIAISHINESNIEYLIAFVETEEDIQVHELRNKLKKVVPAHSIPNRFITVDSLPYNANGKLNRAELIKFVPKQHEKIIEPVLVDKLSQIIFDIWAAILGHKNFDLDHSFFDSGGNSITIVKLYMKLRETFPECNFEMSDMFTYTTINQTISSICAKRLKKGLSEKEEDVQETKFSNDIAIIGISGRLPCADNIETFWDNLLSSKECVRKISEERKALDLLPFKGKTYLDWGYIENADKFDPLFFSISPKTAVNMDPHHRLMLETAYLALEDSGYFGVRNTNAKTGVFLGAILPLYINHLKNVTVDEILSTNLPSNMAGRIAYHLGLEGPALMVDTACSSSLVALHYAAESIRSGDCDSALVGGCYIELESIDKTSALRSGIVSENGRCRSFSDKADGTIGGEGCLAVVLKSLSRAIKDEDNIYAVIKGSAVVQDGARSNGLTAPSAEAQAECIRKAWRNANVMPQSISYIEAHGSATKLGDPIEINGIRQAFQAEGISLDEQKIALGCVKSNIGHLDTVAGLAGLIKTTLCLQRKKLVPTLYYENPNPFINFETSPVYVETNLKEWNQNIPLRAGVSSFGLSGTNCHVILEETPKRKSMTPISMPYYICVFSAMSLKTLYQQLAEMADYLKRNPNSDIIDIAYTLGMGRRLLKIRQSFVAETTDMLYELICAWLKDYAQEGFCEGKYGKKEVDKNRIQFIFNSLSQTDKLPESFNIWNSRKEYAKIEDFVPFLGNYVNLAYLLVGLGFNETAFKIHPLSYLAYCIAVKNGDVDDVYSVYQAAKKECRLVLSENPAIWFGGGEITDIPLNGYVVKTLNDSQIWAKIAEMFDEGYDINLMPLLQGRLISLPNTPFDHVSYWLPITDKSSTEMETSYLKETLDHITQKKLLHEIIWQATNKPDHVKNKFKTILLFSRNGFIEDELLRLTDLMKQLTENSIFISHATHFSRISETKFEMDFTCEAHYAMMNSYVLETFGFIDMQFTLIPADRSKPTGTSINVNEVRENLYFTIQHIQSMCKAILLLEKKFIYPNCFIISGGFVAIKSDLPCDPMQSAVISLNRAINAEIESLESYVIDLDSFNICNNDCLKSILFSLPSDCKEWALRMNEIYTPAFVGCEINHPPVIQDLFRNNGVYLFTGGLGGIALEIAAHVATRVKAQFILVSRTQISELQNKEDKETAIQRIRNLGSQVDIVYIDISDYDKLEQLSKSIQQKYGRLNGVLHTAGIPGKRKIFHEYNEDDFNNMFKAKVYGTILLEQTMRKLMPEFIILFSSVDNYVTLLSNFPYAFANSFMQSFSEAHRQLGKCIININWGGWRFVGMSEDGDSRDMYSNVREFGKVTALKTGFTPEDGLLAFDAITALRYHNSFVAFIDNQDEQMLRDRGFQVIESNRGNNERQIQMIDKDTLKKHVNDVWKTNLGLEEIDVNKNFYEYGGDSINAVTIIYQLEDHFKLSLSADLILEYDTVNKLTDYLFDCMIDHDETESLKNKSIPKANPIYEV